MKPKAIGDLNKIYEDADSCDQKTFAEMRSNVLLIAGEHYTKRGTTAVNNALRDSKELSDTQKLRLTKNHTHRALRHYTSNIMGYAPGVCVKPRKDRDLQQRKAAELNQAVWENAKDHHRLGEKFLDYCDDMCGVGEVAVKVFFDPNAGDFIGYSQKVDENGQPVVDETGQMVKDEASPVFKGDFIFERIYGYNLLRESGAKEMRGAKCWIIRKMVDTGHLKLIYKDDEDKLKMISETDDDTYVVFDSSRASYGKSKGQTLVREFYYPPCGEYPLGYYYITTRAGVLAEGELPFGIFPIVWQGFDVHQSTPRATSMVKIARPYQAEINRASSAMAMHQVTLGDDKILYQSGTKLAQGALLPGVRGITYQGPQPTVLEGRTGGQYLDYILAQVAELDKALMIDEINQDNQVNLDPNILLYRALKQKKKFGKYGTKFEIFLKDLCELYLKLAKHYLPDDALIAAVGKAEYINISEFRSTTPLEFMIAIEEREDTLETMFGRQISMQHALQYVGSQLGKDEIGMMLKNLPFGNMGEAFADLTIDYENVTNDMLAMERGEAPPTNRYDNHQYAVKKLVNRMKQEDYELLAPEVKALYDKKVQEHEQALEEEAQAIADAKNEYIPVGGALIACDMYVPNESDPSKAAKRIRVPYQALDWLVKMLDKQGMSLASMESMNQGALAEMAQSLKGQLQPPSPQQSGAVQQ